MANTVRVRTPPNILPNLAQIYRSVYTTENMQSLPTCWSPKDRSRCLKLSQLSITVTYGSDANEGRHSSSSSEEPAAVRSDHSIPLSAGIYYFETTILHCDSNWYAVKYNTTCCSTVSIGISTKRLSLSKLPGLDSNSFAFHSDGLIYNGSQANSCKFGPKYLENDIIGCGIDLISKSLFFTRNGKFLGKAFEGKIPVSASAKLYPAIGLQGQGCRITTNFGDQPFQYDFKRHITEEREIHETYLINSVTKDFMGAKMRELVAGYLVHHGYIASARAFSRWSNLAGDSFSSSTGPLSMEVSNAEGSLTQIPDKLRSADLPQTPEASKNSSQEQLPGLGSMLHRRRLRAFCRRCQYGRAVASLTRLYPQVVERYPELLVQLRCRQLVEMMHRHSMQRIQTPGETADFSSHSHCNAGMTSVKSDPSALSSSICGIQQYDLSFNSALCGAMEVDADQLMNGAVNTTVNRPKSASVTFCAPCRANGIPRPPLPVMDGENGSIFGELYSDGEDDESILGGLADEVDVYGDDDDDDAFGMEAAPPSQAPETTCIMEVDHQPMSSATPNTNNSEMNSLLRQVQFGRSLMHLVKEVRKKTGGFSLETERLLEQSVSLLAYPIPSSPDCPLRGLLDPSLRDAIASLINSAILKEAHNLPAQPAIEQGLHALQQCFANRSLLEAQTLGHFVLYHLSPSDYATELHFQQLQDLQHSTFTASTAHDFLSAQAPAVAASSSSSSLPLDNNHSVCTENGTATTSLSNGSSSTRKATRRIATTSTSSSGSSSSTTVGVGRRSRNGASRRQRPRSQHTAETINGVLLDLGGDDEDEGEERVVNSEHIRPQPETSENVLVRTSMHEVREIDEDVAEIKDSEEEDEEDEEVDDDEGEAGNHDATRHVAVDDDDDEDDEEEEEEEDEYMDSGDSFDRKDDDHDHYRRGPSGGSFGGSGSSSGSGPSSRTRGNTNRNRRINAPTPTTGGSVGGSQHHNLHSVPTLASVHHIFHRPTLRVRRSPRSPFLSGYQLLRDPPAASSNSGAVNTPVNRQPIVSASLVGDNEEDEAQKAHFRGLLRSLQQQADQLLEKSFLSSSDRS